MAASSSSSSSSAGAATLTSKAPPQRQQQHYRNLRSILLRPSLWTCLISIVAYWDKAALHGKFVYDDSGSVKNNVVVNGKVPLKEVLTRDFWGQNMTEPQSHKSFRPVTTLTFRLNWVLSEWLGTNNASSDHSHTYGFHIVNVVLHGIVTGLVTESAYYVFCQRRSSYGGTGGSSADSNTVLMQLITGLLFGLHPVHAEAVSNITSRGELLMSFFFLVAFLSYAKYLPYCYSTENALVDNSQQSTSKNGPGPITDGNKNDKDVRSNDCNDSAKLKPPPPPPPPPHTKSVGTTEASSLLSLRLFVAIYVVPWICMTLSLFCKEQGATTLISLVVYDFVYHQSSIQEFLEALLSTKQDDNNTKNALGFVRRTMILAIQTVVVCIWRYWLNGETSPDFIFDQNPAGFSSDRFTRVFSVSWVYCLYIFDSMLPIRLCPDWSGLSIDLITSWKDVRVVAVLALWFTSAACLLTIIFKPSKANAQSRRVILVSFFAFTFSPFLLSSNLIVVVGLMKADRVIYLPLMGFCIFEAWLFQWLCCCYSARNEKKTMPQQSLHLSTTYWVGYAIVLIQLALFCAKVHERNLAWSDSLRLWLSAYQINPVSYHTIYNCGYELSLQQRYNEAEQVLRPLADPYVNGASNTFVYAMVLYNLDRCNQANVHIDRAFEALEEMKEDDSVRNTKQSLARTESNLLVARAFCSVKEDIAKAGKLMYAAVQKDPTNEYAVQQATALLERIKKQQEVRMMMQQQPQYFS